MRVSKLLILLVFFVAACPASRPPVETPTPGGDAEATLANPHAGKTDASQFDMKETLDAGDAPTVAGCLTYYNSTDLTCVDVWDSWGDWCVDAERRIVQPQRLGQTFEQFPV